jgi:hypothetical protein
MSDDLEHPSATWGRIVLEGDTATRRAGLSAREEAKKAHSEAPVRSILGRVLGVHTDERAWRRGATGEEEVARRLAKLPSETWTVVHDIPIGERGANIDHLVVGPPGIFTLNTKHLTGKVWVAEHAFLHNGHKTDYLRKARAESKRASKLLSAKVGRSVYVHPVLVVMGAELTIKSQPRDVAVVARRKLRSWLEQLPSDQSEVELKELSKAVRLPSTWQQSPTAPRDSTPSESPPFRVQEGRLTVKLWSRYGKRRLYVNDVAGTSLGFYDLGTNSLSVQNTERQAEIQAVVAEYLRRERL